MKIALYSTFFFDSKPDLDCYGGLELIVGELAKYCDEHGHEVHLFATDGSYQPRNGKLWSAGQAGTKNEIDAWKGFMANPDAKKALLECDIVHDHSWLYCPYTLFNERKGKIIKTHHGPDCGFNPQNKPPYGKMNLVGVSHNVAKSLTEMSGMQWRGVQNGIMLDRYPFKKEKQDYLLWVSRIFPPKGCHRFIDICDRMRIPGKICGGSFGQEPDYIALIKKKLENSKCVKLVGELGKSIPFQEKLELYQNARAVMMPVEEKVNAGGKVFEFKEPFGLIAVESLAAGTPFIVTPSGGWNETTVHGLTGFFANSDEDFMACIGRLDEIKPEDCHEHSKNFSYEKMSQNYLFLYKEILGMRGW